MTVFNPIYRLTAYSPRSVDVDEATPLVPRAGALHTNPFRVATKDHGKAVRIGATISRYLVRQPVATWPTTNLTIECWGRLDTGVGNDKSMLTYNVAGNDNQIIWAKGGAGQLTLFIKNVSLSDADPFPSDAKYHHYAATWRSSDGATVFYIDGVVAHSGTLSTGASIDGAGAFVVGQEQDSPGGTFDAAQAWVGELDEARIYNRVLSAAEIKQHAGGIYIDETGLCGRWGFDMDGVPGIGKDSAGLNDLTPVGIDSGTIDTVLHFYPYLRTPEGLHGIFDPLTRSLDAGEMTAGLVDRQMTPGQNLQRYITQYLGDAKNRNQLLGLKTRWEESLDNGFTWASYWTGRMNLTGLEEKNAYRVPCRDGVDELDVDIFTSRPHSSLAYTAPPQVWPLGPPIAYGGLQQALPVKGTIGGATGFVAGAGIKSVFVITDEYRNPRNQMTPLLQDVSGSWLMGSVGLTGNVLASFFPEGITYSTRARLKLKRLDTLASGEFQLGVVRAGSTIWGLINGAKTVFELVLAEVAVTDPAYLAMPPNATSVECSVILVGKPTEEAPLYINDVHVVQLLKDLVLGKFGRLNADGTVIQAFTPEPTSFAALIADQTLPSFRGKITGKETLRAFAQKSLLSPPYNLGWRLDADNQVVVFDTRRPSSLAGIGTITGADLIESKDAFQWEQARSDAITQIEGLWYVDVPIAADGSVVTDFASKSTLYLRTAQMQYLDITFGRSDLGQKRQTFDAVGFRAMPGELVQGQSRLSYIRRQLERGLDETRAMFSSAPAYATLKCKRTVNTRTWQVGQIKIVDVDPMPDPATNLRGGARVMMCVARDVRKVSITFRVVDLGPNAIAAAPTSSGLATDAADTAHGFSLAVALNGAGDPVVLEYAVTDAAVVVRPLDTDPLWTYAQRLTVGATVKVVNLPAGMKIWPRHRSVPSSETNTQLPSVWSYPSVTGSVTLAALAAPSALGDSEITGRRFVVTFTPGDTRLPTEVLLATPTSDPRVRVKTLPPGAARAELVDLELSTTYRVGLRHRDSLGGLSAEVTRDVATTGVAAIAPDLGGLSISIGAA